MSSPDCESSLSIFSDAVDASIGPDAENAEADEEDEDEETHK